MVNIDLSTGGGVNVIGTAEDIIAKINYAVQSKTLSFIDVEREDGLKLNVNVTHIVSFNEYEK